MFNPFKFYTYTNYRITLAVDVIEQDRFTRERLAAQTRASDKNDKDNQKEKVCWIGWARGIVDSLVWMLEYNQLNLYNYAMFSLVNLIVVANSILYTCYVLRPKDRDPATGEYLDPFLRFFESQIYWIDYIVKSNDTGALHRLMLVMCIPLMSRRLESVVAKFQNAKRNRHRYAKLDLIQLNMAQLDSFKVDSLASFLAFLRACARHDCAERRCGPYAIRTSRGPQIRARVESILKTSKIDWLYYNNLIEFDDCYREARQHFTGRTDQVAPEVEAPTLQQTSRPLRQRLVALCQICTNAKRRPLFIPRSYHRMDPVGFHQFALLYIFVTVGVLGFAAPVATSILYYPVLVVNGLDEQNILGTLCEALVVSLTNPIDLIELLELVAFVASVALQVCDTASLVHCALIASSRSRLVIDMLQAELDFYNWHIRAFAKFLVDENFTISGLEDDLAPANNFGWLDGAHHHGSSPLCLRSDLHRLAPAGGGGTALVRCRSSEQLVREFRRTFVDEKRVFEFNENVVHSLRLIRVLESEQKDLKEHFTWSLNMSVIAGTVGLSIASSLFYESQSVHDVLVVSIPTVTLLLPIAVSLFTGATSEGSFRQITKTLEPLMVDELKLVDPSVVRDIQRMYAHMSVIENRSFMILGSIPLTFASLTSIIGWIATFNLLFQQYVS